MPQLSLPEIKLSEVGERLQDATDDLPEDVRERLSDAAERLSEAADRLSDAADRASDLKWPAGLLPAAVRALSELRFPSLSAQAVRAPKVDLPRVDLPKLGLRNMDIPKMDLRHVDLPKVDLPKVDLPHVDARELRRAVAKLEIPQVTVGKPKAGPPVVPLMILAAVGGAFVGWWLATSSLTGGRVREFVQDAKARLGLADRAEAEDRTEDFWADERGWTAGGTSAAAAEAGEGALRAGADADTAGDAEEHTQPFPTPAWPSETEGEVERRAPVASAWTEGTDPGR